MAFIQNTVTDLDDLLITIGSAQGQNNGAATDTVADVTFTATDTITRAAGDFSSPATFAVGDFIQITGAASAANNVIVEISAVGTTTLTVYGTPLFVDLTASQSVTFTVVNNIEVTTTENHGLKPEAVFRGTTGDFPTTSTFDDQGATFVTDGIVVGDTLTFLETEGSANDGLEVLVTAVTETLLTVAGTPFTVEGTDDQEYHIVRRQYVTITNCANYNGRYIVRKANSDSDTIFTVTDTIANNNNITSTITGEAFGDNNKGIYFTPEIEIDARAGVLTFELRNAGNLTTLGSGVQGQALYSFFKERWKEVPGLTRFDFPMLSITNEQFEFINSWIPKNDLTRKMIRTAGWAERTSPTVTPANTIIREYAGIISLGSLGDTDQPYFVQDDATNAFILETDFTGPVNEAVLDYLSVTATALDDLTFVGDKSETALTVDFPSGTSTLALDGTTNFAVLTDLVAGDVIQISGSTLNDGYYEVVSSSPAASPGTITVKTKVFTSEPDAAGITISRVPGIRSVNTRLDYFSVGSVININYSGTSNFNGKVEVVNTSGYTQNLTEGTSNYFLEIKYSDPASPSLSTGGAVWQASSSTTSSADTHLLFDQRTTFKIFVRERGKTYADSELADIGVTQMTYIVYRFPVSNATDLDINTTNDNAIVGVNLGLVRADTDPAVLSISGHSSSAALSDITTNAVANTIVTAGATDFTEFFTAGHEITLASGAGYTPVTSNMSSNFNQTFTIESVTTNTLTVSGGQLSTATNTTDYTGSVDLLEEHGFYTGAPVQIDGSTTFAPFNAAWTVQAVPNSRVFVVPYQTGGSIAAGNNAGRLLPTATDNPSLSARLQYIGQPSQTYIDLEYFEDTYPGLEILGQYSAPAGGLVSASTISIDGTVISDSAPSPTKLGAFMVGAYIVIDSSGTPAINTFSGGTFPNSVGGATLTGTGLEYKIVAVESDGSSITVDNSIGTYTAGALATVRIYQLFNDNQVVQETDDAVNSLWYRVSDNTSGKGVATVSPKDDTSAGGATNDDVSWNGYFGTSDQDLDAGIDPQDDHGAAFQVEANQKSAYRVVLDTNSDTGNTGADNENESPTATKEIVYEWAQWALRQSSTIDSPAQGAGSARRVGKIADSLVTFVGDTLETSQGVFVADIATVDVNNIRFYDYNNATHVFPLEVLVTINFNDNLNGQLDSAVFYAYYTTLTTGNNFGTNNALQVNRSTPTGQLPVGSDVQNEVPVSKIYQFNYAYASDTANASDGKGAGRTGGTDQNITVVAIGLSTGQYVKATGDITENGATISLVAPLERNYTDPND